MLSDAERGIYYQAKGFAAVVAREIEEMRLGSPARKVTQSGLKNIVVDFFSRRNERRMLFESYSVEFLYGLEMEIFGTCHEYYAQVGLKNIVRYGRTNSSTVDFMLFEPTGVRLVECKPSQSLCRLADKKPDEWVMTNGLWQRPPVRDWARDRGMSYEIWVPPRPHGIYQANLLTLYGGISEGVISVLSDTCLKVLCSALAERPMTIERALLSVRGLTGQHVVLALANQMIFGPLKSVPLDDVGRFTLYVSRQRAKECDEAGLLALREGLAQPVVSSAALTARSSDHKHGMAKLERVRRMIAGAERVTRRYREVISLVLEADAKGLGALDVCLTHYERSGRRAGQLTGDQERAVALFTHRFRTDSLIKTKTQAHDLMVEHCKAEGIPPASRSTFTARLRKKNQLVRAYTEGGYRGYHAVEPAIDPADRTLRCQIPGLMVHVDSTKFDIRCSPDLLAKLGFDCPTIYIAMDSATGRPLGRAVLFGAACRNALAVLIRDIYARQGFLPRYWIVDQGAEYIGHWFSEFCTVFGATRIQPPAGNPRKNSLAENALGRINAENAHALRGSTAPDQKGRSVTARQKSRATARHNYQTVVGLLDEYVFGDMPETISGANTLSPSEKWDLLTSTFGRVGVAHVAQKDDLLIATSIPIDRDIKIDPRRGIRHLERTYVSTPLLAAMRTLKPLERPRKDCLNPRRMYVRFESGWILATSADELSACGRPDVENLFDLLSDKTVRSENAEGRAASRRKRALRIEQANAEANNTQMELVNDECGGEKARASKSDRWTPRSEEVLPFDSVYEQ